MALCYNLFPNKTYFGRMEFAGIAEDGKHIFRVFPAGGNTPGYPDLHVNMGDCTGNCKPCTKCKLSWRQLHPVAVS